MLRAQALLGSKLASRRSKREPDLTSLINIVFLILIFFIVAGTLRPFSARDLELAKVGDGAEKATVVSSLLVHADGRILYAGQVIELNQLVALVRKSERPDYGKPLNIVADGRLLGSRLLIISRVLRKAGVRSVSVMVERRRQ